MTKEEFKQIPRIMKKIDLKNEELKKLRELSVSMQGLNLMEKVQTSHVNKSMDIVNDILILEGIIYQDYLTLIKMQKEAYCLIEKLEEPEKTVMELRYISGMKWSEVIRFTGYSERRVHQLHKIALDNIFTF